MTEAAGAFLIYGANGYTGELCAREGAARGLAPILAGRRAEALAPLAAELGLDERAFALDEVRSLGAALEGVAVVLHCAGPFSATSRPMVAACLERRVHYLDITGEIEVFEAVFRRDGEAKARGVALLPGAGFDVVPSDGLAARLREALPDAVRLDLAFASDGGGWSRGTLVTMLEGARKGGWIRRAGRYVPIRPASRVRTVEFEPGLPRTAVAIPWGDLATAYRTTGIPDITTWVGVGRRQLRSMRWLGRLRPLLAIGPLRRALQAQIRRRVTGPDAETRARARSLLWGRAEAADGRAVEARLSTPEGYRLTAIAAVECARRVAAGELGPGAWTPSLAFGARFVDSLPGVRAEEPAAPRG